MARPGTPDNPQDFTTPASSSCDFFETEEQAYVRIRAEVEAEAAAKASRAAQNIPQGEPFDPASYIPPQTYQQVPGANPPTYPVQPPAKKSMSTSTKVAIILGIVVLGFVTGLVPAIIAGLIWVVQATFSVVILGLIAYIVYRLTRSDEEKKSKKSKDGDADDSESSSSK